MLEVINTYYWSLYVGLKGNPSPIPEGAIVSCKALCSGTMICIWNVCGYSIVTVDSLFSIFSYAQNILCSHRSSDVHNLMFNFPHNDFIDRIIAIAVIKEKSALMKSIFGRSTVCSSLYDAALAYRSIVDHCQFYSFGIVIVIRKGSFPILRLLDTTIYWPPFESVFVKREQLKIPLSHINL